MRQRKRPRLSSSEVAGSSDGSHAHDRSDSDPNDLHIHTHPVSQSAHAQTSNGLDGHHQSDVVQTPENPLSSSEMVRLLEWSVLEAMRKNDAEEFKPMMTTKAAKRHVELVSGLEKGGLKKYGVNVKELRGLYKELRTFQQEAVDAYSKANHDFLTGRHDTTPYSFDLLVDVFTYLHRLDDTAIDTMTFGAVREAAETAGGLEPGNLSSAVNLT